MANQPTRTRRTGGGQSKPKKQPGAASPGLPAPDMDAFLTRPAANEGHKIPLYTAAGILSAHYIVCRGIDSDAAQMAIAQQQRRTGEILALSTEEEREAALMDAKCKMHAALVAGWSFDNPEVMGDRELIPCTPENVQSFLRDAPQIAQELDKFASRRAAFFRARLEDLRNTQGGSSN